MDGRFSFRDRWGNGIALWVIAFLLLLIPLQVLALRHLDLENDVTTWLPDDDPDARVLHWFHEQFEHERRLLLSWDSSSLNDPRIGQLQQVLLEAGQDYSYLNGIDEVTTPQDVLKNMTDNGIDEATAIERLTGVLIGNGFLKVELTDYGRQHPETSRRAVVEAVNRITGASADVLPAATATDAQETESPTDSFHFHLPEHDFQLRWTGIAAEAPLSAQVQRVLLHLQADDTPLVRRAFFAAGAPVAISISLNENGEENHRETLDAIRSAALSIGIPDEEIRMGGSPIARDRLSREARRAVWNRDYSLGNLYKRTPVLLSALVGVFASFLLLRSVRLSILVMITAIYTCVAVLALVPATGKTLNAVLIVLPDLLLVLTISGAIHVANYWKYAVHQNSENPVADAVMMAWRPCSLASVTTAIGMASLMSAVLAPVREFGTYASIGCLISLAMILIAFPALMVVWPPGERQHVRHSEQSVDERKNWQRLAAWLVRSRTVVGLSCLVLFVFSVIGLQWFRTQTKVIRYFPDHTRIVQDYEFLEESLAGIISVETVLRFDESARDRMNVLERMQVVRDVEDQIAAHRSVSGTLSLADFRPFVERPPDTAPTLQKIRYQRTAQRTAAGIFEDRTEQTQGFARLNSRSLAVYNQGRTVTIEQGDEIWRIHAQSAVMGDVDYRILTDDLSAATERALASYPGVDFVVTGMVPLFLRTQSAVLETLIRSFCIAFGVIAGVMILLLRHPVSGLLAMLPNLFPVGVVFGLVSWAGIPIDIGTMITASVALGIAIDGTLHLLTWFQSGIRDGLPCEESVVQALGHCGPAMWQTSVSISLGMLVLSGADLLLISRFGWLMAALIMTALVADVVLLPALLGGWLGRFIAKTTLRETSSAV